MKYSLLFTLLASCWKRRETVTNSAASADREAAEANAADEPIDAAQDDWIKIAPFGTYPGSKPGRPQHFTEAEANAMIDEFGSFRGRAGRGFRGIPIFIGHPDQNPQLYVDHRRLGKITNLAARQDGLYGEVIWNALGEENKREGYWVYPSPRWDAPAGRPHFRPDRLISVGLTNTPRIVGSEPVTNSDEPTNTDMDRKALTEKLKLDVTATDEEILAKLDALLAEAGTAKAKTEEAATAVTAKETAENSLTEARGTATRLEGELTTEREALANAKLDAAEAAGKITKAQRTEWLPKLTGEKREAEANALNALKPTYSTKPIDVTKSRVELGDEAKRRETVSNAVDVLMTTRGMDYETAWAAAKNDPALKEVWDAMKGEG